MYVDGFVLPVPRNNIEAYRTMAESAGEVWMKHGALAYRECVLEDETPQKDIFTFPQLAQPKEGETIVFAYILYRDKAHRDEVNATVMKEFNEKSQTPEMPFDMARMAYGGFKTLVSLGNS